MAEIANRISEYKEIPVDLLKENDNNWRMHPQAQRDALRDMLSTVGYADAIKVRPVENGYYEIIDGHLRADLSSGGTVPVLILDVTEEEAKQLLLTLDTLAAMAITNTEVLYELLGSVEFASTSVNVMLEALANDEQSPLPNWGEEIDESIADGIVLCNCPRCGHEHHADTN